MRYQVATFLLLSSSLVAAENLLKNGSFEEFELVKGKRLYAEVKLKDWNTPFETVRLWTNRKFGSATDGSYKLALDTHKRAFDQISQEVETKEGVLYELCLDAIARMNRSSQFEIYVDNERVLKVKPSKSKWNRYCVSFVGNGKPQTVAIKELSNEDDGRGAILDNVTLEQSEEIVEITPASTPQEVTDENLSQTQNLVKNGSFEEFEAVRVRKLYTAAKLKDWETTNELMSVIRNGVFGDAIDGNYKLGLDSNKRQFDAISQTITTQAQQLYKVCLWGKKRKSRSSDFKVLIDDEVVIKGYTFGNWRKYCATFRGKGGEQ
ncbi:MAG: DUF642 domain-containing protein, partial [Epsilonproteobacteria bacterium]|nr:DUF642 domain-containing protein [Campylobacterota bacterium]